MANRADRRASAKIARQAVKRAKTPTEGAILRAAAAFAADDTVGLLGACLSNDDFDDAWIRLTDDLHDILEDRYSEFRTQAYAEAGLGTLQAVRSDGVPTEMVTRLFLCPIVGESGRVSAFAADVGEITRLERSLHEAGVVSENGKCLLLPLVIPIGGFAPDTRSPGRTRGLHDYLTDRLTDRSAGRALPSRDSIRDALHGFCGTHSGAAVSDLAIAALVGIELLPDLRDGGAKVMEAELDAEDMARVAAIDSWHDSYAAGIADVSIGAPLDWPACAAALAWETIRIPMEAALRRRGVLDGRPEVIHCATTDDGERVVVSAVSGAVAVGPFSAPANLAWFDADEFFGRAEAGAVTLMEHDNEGDVISPLLTAV